MGKISGPRQWFWAKERSGLQAESGEQEPNLQVERPETTQHISKNGVWVYFRDQSVRSPWVSDFKTLVHGYTHLPLEGGCDDEDCADAPSCFEKVYILGLWVGQRALAPR